MATQTFSAPAFMLGASTPGKSILIRWYEAILTSRQRHADRMIAAYVNRLGGKFTDQIERNIETFATGTSRSFGDVR